MIILAFAISFLVSVSDKRRIKLGHKIDIENPFIIHKYLMRVKSLEMPTIRLIVPDRIRLIKTIHFKLYFLQNKPLTTCPTPYEKKKKVLTKPAVEWSIL
jgi:hypothetical protein